MTDDNAERLRSHPMDEKREAAREFLERLCTQQYVICQWQAADPADPSPGAYQPVPRTIEGWLEQLFGRDTLVEASTRDSELERTPSR